MKQTKKIVFVLLIIVFIVAMTALEEPKFSLIVGLMLAIISFTFQLLLCLKTCKISVKLVPIYLLITCYVLCLALYFGIFGNWSGGFLGSINKIIAAVFAIVIGFASLGELAAWMVYAIKKHLHAK